MRLMNSTSISCRSGRLRSIAARIAPTSIDPGSGRPGRQVQFSLGIQRELPGKILIDSTYVGNHGVQLISAGEATINLNQVTPGHVA